MLLALAGSCGVLHSACSPEPLATCLATAATRAAAVDRIGEWGSHLRVAGGSFEAGQPMEVAHKIASGIGDAGRAVLEFCSIRTPAQATEVARKIARRIGSAGRTVLEFCGIRPRPQATEVERHECPSDLCMAGAGHEGDQELPLAAWYSAIKDRAAASLRCLPEEAEWLCACKAWVQRWAHLFGQKRSERACLA